LFNFKRFNLLIFNLFCVAGLGIAQSSDNIPAPEGPFIDGKKSGEWVYFYPNGEKSAVEHYKNGVLWGSVVYYMPDGTKSAQENWENGILEDSAFYYHDNGLLEKEGVYQNGNYHGVWRFYYPDGQLKRVGIIGTACLTVNGIFTTKMARYGKKALIPKDLKMDYGNFFVKMVHWNMKGITKRENAWASGIILP
jgi:hypothetical protein